MSTIYYLLYKQILIQITTPRWGLYQYEMYAFYSIDDKIFMLFNELDNNVSILRDRDGKNVF